MCLLCDCVEGTELTHIFDVFAVWLRWGGLNWHRQLMCLLCDCIEGDWVDKGSWCVCCVIALRGIELTQTVDVFAVLLRWGDWVDKGSWYVYCVIVLRGTELTHIFDVFAVWLCWGGLNWHRQLMCLLCDCVEGDWVDTDSWCVCCVTALRGLSWHRQLMCLLCDCIEGDWVDKGSWCVYCVIALRGTELTYIWCVCCVIALRGIELTQTVDGFAVLLRWGGLSWHRQLMCLLCYCVEGDWVDTDSWCVCCVTALRGIELTQTVDVFAVLLRWGGWVDKGSWGVCCVTALRGIELTQTVDVFVAAAGPE